MVSQDQVLGASAAGAFGLAGFLAAAWCFAGFLAFMGFFSMVPAGAAASVLVWAIAGLSINAELTPSAISSFFKCVLHIAAKVVGGFAPSSMSNPT